MTSRLSDLTAGLEPTVDLLADGVHRLQQLNRHAARVADGVKGVWARRLEAREVDARREVGAVEFGARDVLRALAGKLAE
jgi:kinetochore protein Mis13/DSN1